MIFLTFFKTLEGKTIIVELKNDLQIQGTLTSVDQYLNLKLDGVSVVDKARFPQLTSVKSMFIRGGVIRYVHIAPTDVETDLLQDAARREAMVEASKASASAASAAPTAAAGGAGKR